MTPEEILAQMQASLEANESELATIDDGIAASKRTIEELNERKRALAIGSKQLANSINGMTRPVIRVRKPAAEGAEVKPPKKKKNKPAA